MVLGQFLAPTLTGHELNGEEGAMSFCTHCGAGLGLDAHFCPECGTALAVAAQAHVQGTVLAPVETSAPASGAADGKGSLRVTAVPVPRRGDVISTGTPEPHVAPAGATEHILSPATGAGTARAAIKLSQLSPAQTSAAAKDGLLALAAVSGVLLVTVALAAGIFAPEGHHGSPADWLQTAVIILGLGVHAPAELHVAVAAGHGLPADASFVVAATFTPLIVTALVGFGCFWFARRTERRLSSQDAKAAGTASVLTGAVFAGAAALLALLASGMPGFGLTGALLPDASSTASLGANVWYLLPAAFALTASFTFLGRMTALARSRGVPVGQLATSRVRPWLADLRTAKNLTFGAAAVAALGLACALGWSGIDALFFSDPGTAASVSAAPGPGAKTVLGAILVVALLLPNLIVAVVGFALGGTLGVSGSGSVSSSLLGSAPWAGDLGKGVGLFTGGVPTTAYLILLPMLLMALAFGVRAAVQRAPGEPYGPHVWRTSALFASAWVLPAFLVRVSASISGNAAALSQSGDAQGSASAGLGVAGILIVALLWGTIAALGGALIVRFVAAVLPKPVSWLGGFDMDSEWELLLADAVLVRGGKMPARLAAAADDLRGGARPQTLPLDVHPERDRLLAVSAASMIALVLAATIGYRLVQDNVYGPNAVVKEYLSAVASHNVPAALQLLDASTNKNLDKSLLTSAAMGKVPSTVSIESATVTGDRATVTVNQTFDNARTQAKFTLTREGSAAAIFDTWRLNSPFTLLTVATDNSAASSSLTVNGVAASADTHPVFPGVYTVAQPKAGLYQAAHTQVTATGDGAKDATISGQLDPSVQQAADQAVHKMLDTCAKLTDPAPTGCPFSYDNSAISGDIPTNVHWSITGYATVSANVNPNGTISLSTMTQGAAHLSALSTNWAGTVTPVSQDPTFNVSGTLNWDGGDPSTAWISLN